MTKRCTLRSSLHDRSFHSFHCEKTHDTFCGILVALVLDGRCRPSSFFQIPTGKSYDVACERNSRWFCVCRMHRQKYTRQQRGSKSKTRELLSCARSDYVSVVPCGWTHALLQMRARVLCVFLSLARIFILTMVVGVRLLVATFGF